MTTQQERPVIPPPDDGPPEVRPTSARPANPPPAVPEPQATPARPVTPARPGLRKLGVPMMPLIIGVALTIACVELMLAQGPRWLMIAVNALAVVLVVLWRRAKSRSRRAARRSLPRRERNRLSRTGHGGIPGRGGQRGGLLGGLRGLVGGGRRGGTPTPGRTSRGGLLGRVTGGRLGTRRGTSGTTGTRTGSGRSGGGLFSRGLGRRGTGRPAGAGLGASRARPGSGGSSAPRRGRGGLLGRAARGAAGWLGFGGGRRPVTATGGPAGSRPRSRTSTGSSTASRGSGGLLHRMGARVAHPFRKAGTSAAGKPSARGTTKPTETNETTETRPASRPAPKPSDVRPSTPKRPGASRPSDQGGTPVTDTTNNFRPPTDDASLFTAGEGLKHAPGTFEEWARQVRGLARSLREDQPMTEAVPDAIDAAAAVLEGLARDAGAWYGSYRRGNEADIGRAETPRKGSHHVEQKADNAAARRDGL